MTHVSRSKLSDEVLQQIMDSFLYVLTNIKDKDSMAEFLNAFLSKTERIMFAKRLALVYLLSEGIEETKISQTLHITQAHISRMKLVLETKGAGYQKAFAKIRKQKLLEDLKILALKLANYGIRAAGGRI